MTLLDDAEKDPIRFDFFVVMRHLERNPPDRPSAKPRIGRSASLAQELVRLGQDTYLEFPDSNLARVTLAEGMPPSILVRFLGLLGPQGALPNATTEEALGYVLARDESFPRFLDLFNHRFLQLFFRAWADSRPIVQNDRHDDDSFVAYVGAPCGLGSPVFHDLDSVADDAKLSFAGLLAPAARGASRLAAMLTGLLGVNVEVDEFVGFRLELDDTELTRLGRNNARIGADTMLGRTSLSAQDKFRVRLFAADMPQYRRFLPSGDLAEPLADLVYFYMGDEFDWDAELALPAGKVEPVRLSRSGQLGWTTWLSPNWADTETTLRCDARFHPAERLRRKRAEAARAQARTRGTA